MIFSPDLLPKVLNGAKTQTRRLMKDGEFCSHSRIPGGDPGDYYITTVWTPTGRKKWAVGETAAVCPGRKRAAVARIRITNIRQEAPIDMSDDDARAEGFTCTAEVFNKLRSLYGDGYDLTRPHWAITFELVEDYSRDE